MKIEVGEKLRRNNFKNEMIEMIERLIDLQKRGEGKVRKVGPLEDKQARARRARISSPVTSNFQGIHCHFTHPPVFLIGLLLQARLLLHIASYIFSSPNTLSIFSIKPTHAAS